MQRECSVICCSPRCQVGFHTWPTTCFDFDKPDTVTPESLDSYRLLLKIWTHFDARWLL